MNDVELRFPRDLHDSVRQREEILRLPEQRVGRRQHLMEEQALLEVAEPEGRLRADEVRLVAAQRQRLSQLRRDDPASAD
jgi:hypothetical protein